ncbi:hypothetical protein [Hymenobacter bucti]|uniref:Carboxypeptidase-like regulatory domain-containing protein n=1 Tax=Hymenobacter bucti TaxID=1844114 RepID=A0ABW4QWW2_9BACT
MAQHSASVHIPSPCAASWAAMTPTAAGRHCAACRTEVVDFTAMSEAELLAYLTARTGQQLCGRMAAPAAASGPSKWQAKPLRWLLAVAALCGWQAAPAAGLPPQIIPGGSSLLKPAIKATITTRGVVMDDLYNIPVEGAYVFIKGTKYGAVTDAGGNFTLLLLADWPPIKGGVLTLLITSNPFSFLAKTVKVNLRNNAGPARLTIRLLSPPERGTVMGKPVLVSPPATLPTPRKTYR